MQTITFVIKNFSRRKGRLIFSSVGLILAIAVIVAAFTISSSMQTQLGDEVDKYGANIVVTPKSQTISVPYGNILVGNVTTPESSVNKILTIKNRANIRVLSPKLYGQIQYENNSLLIVGAIPEREATLKKWWEITGSLPKNNSKEVLLGSAVESALKLDTGSVTSINGVAFTISGILKETSSVDDYSVFMPLQVAQQFLNQPGVVSVIDVGSLCNNCPVEDIAQQIMEVLPQVKATPVQQAAKLRMTATEQTANFSLLLGSIILIVGAAGIMNTMLSSIHERTREIGILMSLGADSFHLYRIFILEALILGIFGGLIGTIGGLASSVTIGAVFMKISVSLLDVPILPIPLSIVLSITACVAASLYPSWRASKTDPVQALRAV